VAADHEFDYRGLSVSTYSPDGDAWDQYDKFSVEVVVTKETSDWVKLVNYEIEILDCDGDSGECKQSGTFFLEDYYGVEFRYTLEAHTGIYLEGEYNVRVCLWDYTEYNGYPMQDGLCTTTYNEVQFEKSGSRWIMGSVLILCFLISYYFVNSSEIKRDELYYIPPILLWLSITYIYGFWRPSFIDYFCSLGCFGGLLLGAGCWFYLVANSVSGGVKYTPESKIKQSSFEGQCKALTVSGSRCKKNALFLESYCHIHKK